MVLKSRSRLLVLAATAVAVVVAALLVRPAPLPAQEPTVNVAPAPPAGGTAVIVAGTADIVAFVHAQQFEVESIWTLDIVTQRYLV
jgi:hypothetical protein